MIYKCVYCGHEQDTPFNKEHVIQRGLGCFKNDEGRELYITNRVCNDCNQDIDDCDAELCYAGPEAMLRLQVGIIGRHKKGKKWSPFHKNPFSKEPIIMKGKRPEKDEEDYWEVDPDTGYAIEKRSVVFTHPESRERMEIPLERGMTKKNLITEMQKKGYPGGDYPWELFCEDDDKEWIKKLLGDDYEKIKWQDRRHLKPMGKIDIEATATITDKHHRGIAKIAFNYMMYFKPLGITGYEKEFEPIRKFIKHGKGHPNNFVRMSKREIIYGISNYVNLCDYGHIVTCSVNGVIKSFVHILTGRELGHKPYEIILGKYPFKIKGLKENIGHWFRITKTDRKEEDTGEIVPLFAPNAPTFADYDESDFDEMLKSLNVLNKQRQKFISLFKEDLNAGIPIGKNRGVKAWKEYEPVLNIGITRAKIQEARNELVLSELFLPESLRRDFYKVLSDLGMLVFDIEHQSEAPRFDKPDTFKNEKKIGDFIDGLVNKISSEITTQ